MGFVSEELNETEKRLIQQNKVNNMAVVYGKEASMWKVASGAGPRRRHGTGMCVFRARYRYKTER